MEAENLDSTEEFIVDEEMVMYKQEDPIQSHPTIYTQEWLDLRLSTPEVPQSKTHSRQFDTIDPEGLMEHITTVPIKKRGRGRPRKHVVKKSIFEFNPTSVRIKKEFDL